MIPYSRQQVTEEDIEAVVEVLRSEFLTQGQTITTFENQLCRTCEVDYAVACANATAALHLSCMALGVQQGDLVWTSAISFVASANCALFCGAEIDFVDVDPSDGLISVPLLREKLSIAEQEGNIPKALIVVHLAGQSCAMKEIYLLCRHYGVKIIEDASHALGATYAGEPVGSCRYSDVAVFSFHPVKPITSGEGGALTTNDEEIAKRARLFASHGIVRDEHDLLSEKQGDWYYEQQMLGFNYRLSDIHAALGNSQLSRVASRAKERAELAASYIKNLKDFPIEFLAQSIDGKSAWHLLIIRVKPDLRKDLFDQLRGNGFLVNLHYIPIPSQPYYQKLGFDMGDYPGATAYSESAISLPLYSGMDIEVLDRIKDTLEHFFKPDCVRTT